MASTLNNILKTAALSSVVATQAYADITINNATVENHFSQVTEYVPENKHVCEIVKVPVYGSNTSGADVLGGMILGGLLGKGITGKDNGAAAGAIIGGVIAGDQKRITSYRDEKQCRTVVQYNEILKTVYDYSIINFTINGIPYSLQFYRMDMLP